MDNKKATKIIRAIKWLQKRYDIAIEVIVYTKQNPKIQWWKETDSFVSKDISDKLHICFDNGKSRDDIQKIMSKISWVE